MEKGTCWSHSEYYGGTCPHCAAEANAESVADTVREAAEAQAAAVAAAVTEAARKHAEEEEKTRRAVAESAARHEKAIAEDWKFRAEAKGVRAAQLFQAGMWKETVDLARDAIAHDDPGNIRLHIYAARALLALGSEYEARCHFDKQIALLRMPDYSGSPAAFCDVFDGLPNDSALLNAFDDAAERASPSWPLGGKLLLAEKFASRGRARQAKRVFWSQVDAEEAALDSMEIWARTVVAHADLIELSVKIGDPYLAAFRRFLNRVPCKERSVAVSGFGDVLKHQEKYSARTLGLMTETIRARYEEWRPEVATLIRQESEAWAGVPSSGWATGIVTAVVAGGVVLWMANSFGSSNLESDLVFAGIIVFAICTGIVAGLLRRAMARRAVRGLVAATSKSLWDREQVLWGALCGNVRSPQSV